MPGKRQCGPERGLFHRTYVIHMKNNGKKKVIALSALRSASALKNQSENNNISLARTRAHQIDKSIWSTGAALFGAAPVSKSRETSHAKR